jgi:hypothetical protein
MIVRAPLLIRRSSISANPDRSPTGSAPLTAASAGAALGQYGALTLRKTFGFGPLDRPNLRELLAWLVPIALATTDVMAIATALMDEMRRRRLIVPGPSIVERLVAVTTALAERRVAHELIRRETRSTGRLRK